jgi:CDP-glucose 4,6-dehydratase
VELRGRAVAGLVDSEAWRGRRVLVTGHTGFKGGWLVLWLRELGADCLGLSLGPPGSPSLHEVARVDDGLETRSADVRDRDAVEAAIRELRPELVVHMAAQPLVRRSYADPLGTDETNAIGTANVLAASREAAAVVVVTSDKCYAPRADGASCREDDPLGGADPYSSSKACAELVTAAWRASFGAAGPAIASVRAGNVIGGGDWAEDRLVPDAMRAALDGRPLVVRNPEAVRPWQHVLNPLSGYLIVAERLLRDGDCAEPWNFGPDPSDELTVGAVADRIAARWGEGFEWTLGDDRGPAETAVLRVDSTKARERLGWTPGWTLDAGLDATVEWFRAWRDGADAHELCVEQIHAFSDELAAADAR